ncbi:B12-binding domain-containing radical SAM protein [uncultured Eubacterium sp.]|uniref:B12-binding domain-containing radical SAM protein n=1 Tax=uncultured Eubacterium sp. TaxID=165185 RepID=UPI0025D7596D|nr:radical SAM protein [uncultured Eubacterium sp.]MCI6537722.1 B12-binding domain-containing radical SAM protein [Lachnospiraceae bacterium]
MKIVFIVPAAALRRIPLYRLGGKIYGQANSITGPLILGGILKRAGHQVEVYEELNARLPLKKLLRDTDIFCLSLMSSNAPRGYELADIIHRETDAKVIIGGIHPTSLPQEALQHADQVIVGEGEQVILDVIEGRRREPIVSGITLSHVDEAPFPDYSILKTPCVAANVISTRGCPYCCTFCTTSRMFAPYRQRSVDNVIAEIRMYKQMGFRYLNFEDDNFTADKERAKEICRRMIRENLVFKESFFFGRTDMANDEELLQLLHDAHLTRVLIGIESLNQSALDSIHKGQNIEDIRRAGAACEKYKIRMIASIVLGLDEDTKKDMDRSIAFAKSIHAYQLQPAILTPFPGTPVYEQFCQEHRMLPGDWSRFDMMHVTFLPAHMTPWELQETFYQASRSFYDFRSIRDIRRIFGTEYALRRFGLALMARLGVSGAHIASRIAKKSVYYELRHYSSKASTAAASKVTDAT